MSDRKRETARMFGDAAVAYLESDVHRTGDDLATLADWCAGADRALDVATGGGHTARALRTRGVEMVVAADAAPEMVATAVGTGDAAGIEHSDVAGVVADAERLPFADESFDAVTCRIAAHHFPNPEAFVAEVDRVLTSGGTFAFEDNVAPDEPALAAFLDAVERLRDPTHHELVPVSRWDDRLTDAGLVVEAVRGFSRRLDFGRWTERTGVTEDTERELRRRFREAPDGAAELFGFEHSGDELVSFTNLKALFRARKP